MHIIEIKYGKMLTVHSGLFFVPFKKTFVLIGEKVTISSRVIHAIKYLVNTYLVHERSQEIQRIKHGSCS